MEQMSLPKQLTNGLGQIVAPAWPLFEHLSPWCCYCVGGGPPLPERPAGGCPADGKDCGAIIPGGGIPIGSRIILGGGIIGIIPGRGIMPAPGTIMLVCVGRGGPPGL